MYWLLTDQIIPSKHNFHDNVKEKHEQDWRKIYLSKLYIQACMESFQWRSEHRKLYAKRDLVRLTTRKKQTAHTATNHNKQ
jgi:hypothetical protein